MFKFIHMKLQIRYHLIKLKLAPWLISELGLVLVFYLFTHTLEIMKHLLIKAHQIVMTIIQTDLKSNFDRSRIYLNVSQLLLSFVYEFFTCVFTFTLLVFANLQIFSGINSCWRNTKTFGETLRWALILFVCVIIGCGQFSLFTFLSAFPNWF